MREKSEYTNAVYVTKKRPVSSNLSKIVTKETSDRLLRLRICHTDVSVIKMK